MTGEKECTPGAAIIFIVGLAAGTGCIIASKTLFELEGIGLDGKLPAQCMLCGRLVGEWTAQEVVDLTLEEVDLTLEEGMA